jgi:hypothetical protein
MRCRGLVHNSTHCNDGTDNRFQDSGDRGDDRIEAITDSRDNGTLRKRKFMRIKHKYEFIVYPPL